MSLPAVLSSSVKSCGAEALALLAQLRDRATLATADSSKLKEVLEGIKATAEVRHTYTHSHAYTHRDVKHRPTHKHISYMLTHTHTSQETRKTCHPVHFPLLQA